MKWVLIFFLVLFQLSISAITISIGTGQINNQPLPFDAPYHYSYSQVIYNRSEINQNGMITQICYPYHIVSNNFMSNVNQLKIYMGLSDRTCFQSNSDWFPLDSLQLVFDGNWDVSNFSIGPPGDGWVSIPLTTNFDYDNIHNLIIAFDENQPGCTILSDKFICSQANRAQSIEYHNDTINPDPASPPSANSSNPRFYIANIRLQMITDFPPPSNPYPANVAEFVELLPQFTWTCSADNYDLLIGQQSDQLSVQASSLTVESWSSSNLLLANTTYWWQIRAHYGAQTVESPIWHFTTGSTIGMGIPFLECYDLNAFPPDQWLRMEGLYQLNASLVPTTHGWNWDCFGNQSNSPNGSAKLNIYGRDCFHWLISPPLSGVIGTQAVISFQALLTNWNSTNQGQLGVDDSFKLVLFPGTNATLSTASALHEWTVEDPLPIDNNISLSLPAGIFRIGFYGESTVSNQDCDLFIDDLRIMMESSLSIEPPGNPSAQVVGNIIHLQWTAPTSYIPTGYKVYRNNHLLGTSIISEYNDASVVQGQNYSYFITALNESGSESATSASTSLNCLFTEEPLFYDGFEMYDSFIRVSVPWFDLDIDQHDTFGLPTTDFPNEEEPSAFIVFNPGECNPIFNDVEAFEGQQYLAVFPDSPPPNNDWLITPKLHMGTGSILTFQARSLSTEYGAERFRVGISTNLADPDSFQMISDEPYLQAPDHWIEYSYDLSMYDGQDILIAVQCVSYDCCMFALDEFKVISDGGYVGNEDISIPQPFPTLSVFPNPFHSQCRIQLANSDKGISNIDIYNIRGQQVYHFPETKSQQIDVLWNGKDENHREVAIGVYIVRVSANNRIVCKKIVKM